MPARLLASRSSPIFRSEASRGAETVGPHCCSSVRPQAGMGTAMCVARSGLSNAVSPSAVPARHSPAATTRRPTRWHCLALRHRLPRQAHLSPVATAPETVAARPVQPASSARSVFPATTNTEARARSVRPQVAGRCGRSASLPSFCSLSFSSAGLPRFQSPPTLSRSWASLPT